MNTDPTSKSRKGTGLKQKSKGTGQSKTNQDTPDGTNSNISNGTNSKISDEQLLELSVAEAVSKISKFEQKDVVEKLEMLLNARLDNEFFISQALKHGVNTDEITVDRMSELLKSTKDGLSQLGQLYRLFSGESTSSSESTVRVEHVDIDERVGYFNSDRSCN